MSRRIYSGYSNFVPKGITKTLHTGPGKIRAIVATNETPNTPAVLAMYDNPNGTQANSILAMYIGAAPIVIFYPLELPLVFETGLTVVTGTTIRAHLITEA